MRLKTFLLFWTLRCRLIVAPLPIPEIAAQIPFSSSFHAFRERSNQRREGRGLRRGDKTWNAETRRGVVLTAVHWTNACVRQRERENGVTFWDTSISIWKQNGQALWRACHQQCYRVVQDDKWCQICIRFKFFGQFWAPINAFIATFMQKSHVATAQISCTVLG